ncbi:protein FAR1-RELATED SEQUENCE 6 [Cocos nucifera]|uniref:Protein FAR1-RELATED SEQUENCE n=1 Tax=Cocos nucifera TaxID=13894 RepID=A0A8K0I0H7_COCNU|nr:protein FAR1-RELATED SEQUENCE 6 [Cocos nucifera]
MADDSVRKEPLDVDADINEGKDTQLNGNNTPPVGYKTSQELLSVSPTKESLQGVDKEVMTVDDNGHNFEKKDATELEGDHEANVGDDRTPRVGMVFKSYDEVSSFYKQYALHVGFGVAVRKSQFTKSGVCRRLILACSKAGHGRQDACYQARQTAKTNCQAMIVLKLQGDGLLHLAEANLEHNHPVSPSTARFLSCYKKMTDAMAEGPVAWPNGHRNVQSENEFRNSTEIGRLKLGEGDDEAICQFFAGMQNKNPNFFYLVDLDKHGCLRNLFWADARSRAAYRYFGDVISFDTAYLTEKYDLPLVTFIGMNHHGQSVLLACGLVSDETIETYIWLFKAFLTCMLGCFPTAIITDHCKAIQGAVAEVFPGVRHRLCMFHIMKKIPEKLRGFAEFKAVKKAIKKASYDSLRVNEFEQDWQKVTKGHGLEGNEWLDSLYENRHLWVPAYLKDAFWAGMSISQRGESTTAFFDGCTYPKTSLKQFLNKYEMILQSKYKKEAQADSESLHKTPLTISKFYMEEQLSKLYTVNMFRKFQDELKATMYCDASPIKVDGLLITFEVRECSYMEDGKRTEKKDHEVLYDEDKVQVQCICGSFQFRGILCRHALSVFKLQQVFEIPSHYILDRWKKDYKQLHALAHPSHDMVHDNIMERYDYLSMRCLQLAELGFISDDRFQVALKLIREVEKSLLDDGLCRDRQPIILSFETQPNEHVQKLLVSQLGISDSNKNSNSLQVKRRGRPPKKGRLPQVGSLVQLSKEQDFLRSSLVGNENNMLQSAPLASHLDTHIGTRGGIDLMEEVTPDNLSFGSRFSIHVNHQHHMGNQTRLQSSNLLQGQYDHQTIGSQSRVQWIYQQMFQLQEDQMPNAHSDRRR